jgi:hypothetical protein
MGNKKVTKNAKRGEIGVKFAEFAVFVLPIGQIGEPKPREG